MENIHSSEKRRSFMNAMDTVKKHYSHCDLCPQNCGVNRLNGEKGYCGVEREGRVFNKTLLIGEEEEINPSYGIYFAGCNLNCKFCSVHKHNEFPMMGEEISSELIENIKKDISYSKTKTITFIGGEPTVNLLTILKVIRDLNTEIPLVLNSNMYYNPEISSVINNIFDVVVADIHFGNDTCAKELTDGINYFEYVSENIINVKKKLIVRHLLLPGHIECCFKRIADWMKGYLPDAILYLLTNYFPFTENNGLPSRRLNQKEIDGAMEYAKKISLPIELMNDRGVLKDDNYLPSYSQEIVIDEDGSVVFKYYDMEANKIAEKIGGLSG